MATLIPKMNHVELLDHVFNHPEHDIGTNPEFTSAAYAQRWHAKDHASNDRQHHHDGEQPAPRTYHSDRLGAVTIPEE